MISGASAPDINDYPHLPLPAQRPDTTPEAFPAGHQLGSVDYVEDSKASAAGAEEMFVEAVMGSDGKPCWHPAACLNKANEILKST